MGLDIVKRKEYLKANKEIIAKKKKVYYETNKKNLMIHQKEWINKNRDKIREYQKNKMSNDILYKLKVNVKNLIGQSIREKKFKKLSRTEQILGCSYHEFKQHLESQFLPWMTWDNRGKYNGELDYGWDLDHIKPLSSATTEIELLNLNHYTNLHPLCSYTNRYIKRNKD